MKRWFKINPYLNAEKIYKYRVTEAREMNGCFFEEYDSRSFDTLEKAKKYIKKQEALTI